MDVYNRDLVCALVQYKSRGVEREIVDQSALVRLSAPATLGRSWGRRDVSATRARFELNHCSILGRAFFRQIGRVRIA